MSRGSGHQSADEIASQAAEWFVRLQGEDAAEADWLAFEQWLETPAHAAAYERVEALWVDLDDAKSLLSRQAGARRPLRRAAAQRPSRRNWLVAAGGLAATVAVGLFALEELRPPPGQTWRTAVGETRGIVLADGTRIRLNAASSLRVVLGARERRVEMAEGEAVFDVAHDPSRPFLITVGDRQVRVVGTEFNIRRRNGATAVTVRRGIVEVRPSKAQSVAPIRLTVGRQLTYVDGNPASQVRAVEPAVAFAWTSGQLIYQDVPMADVAADLSRRFGVPVNVADPQTARMPFTGVLVTDDAAAVMRRIEAFAPVTASPRGRGFVLSPRRTQPRKR